MKKLAIPTFVAGIFLLSGTILYGNAIRDIKNRQSFKEEQTTHDLSLKEVRQTNTIVQPNTEYKILYRIRTFTSAEGLKIHTRTDTISIELTAYSETLQPRLPHPLNWGSLPH